MEAEARESLLQTPSPPHLCQAVRFCRVCHLEAEKAHLPFQSGPVELRPQLKDSRFTQSADYRNIPDDA